MVWMEFSYFGNPTHGTMFCPVVNQTWKKEPTAVMFLFWLTLDPNWLNTKLFRVGWFHRLCNRCCRLCHRSHSLCGVVKKINAKWSHSCNCLAYILCVEQTLNYCKKLSQWDVVPRKRESKGLDIKKLTSIFTLDRNEQSDILLFIYYSFELSNFGVWVYFQW